MAQTENADAKIDLKSDAPEPKRLGHVHRGGIYDSEMTAVANLLASHPVPPTRRVVVGLTTTPMRIPHIRPVIMALLNQTHPCEIVLNIPLIMGNTRPHGWHGKPGLVPDWLAEIDPRVHVHRVEQDYGPATKLVGTMIWLDRAGWDNSTMVVATDDDQEWQPYALASLIRHATRDATHEDSAWSYYTYPRRISAGDPKSVSVCVGQGGDMLVARAYHLRKLVTWGKELVSDIEEEGESMAEKSGRLPHCFFVDDMFFGESRSRVYYCPQCPSSPAARHPPPAACCPIWLPATRRPLLAFAGIPPPPPIEPNFEPNFERLASNVKS